MYKILEILYFFVFIIIPKNINTIIDNYNEKLEVIKIEATILYIIMVMILLYIVYDITELWYVIIKIYITEW